MAAALPWISLGLSAVGTFMSYQGMRRAGKVERQRGQALANIADFEAGQMEQQAGQEIAASQRAAEEERRNARLAESRALAVAAASGGGASDPTVSKIIADLSGEGAYRSSVALYEGEEKARQMRLGAVARRYEGKAGLSSGLASQQAYNIAASSSLFSGAGRIAASPTLMKKYGGDGPPSTTGRPPGSWEDTGSPSEYPYA